MKDSGIKPLSSIREHPNNIPFTKLKPVADPGEGPPYF